MKIMLDGGHSFVTPGKRTPDGMKEFEFNSAVAEYARDYLKDYKDVSVYFAHDPSGKTDVSLSARANKANKQKVDVYVSIHANAYGNGWNSANGIETYVYTSKPREAVALAKDVQHQLIKATKLNDRGVKYANFAVLRETNMTAILCECGFMTNKEEAALLKSDAYRKKVAAAIVEGIAEQYKLVKNPTPKPTPKKETPGTDNYIHRVIVDGKQVGAFGKAANVAEAVEQAVKDGAKSVKIERV